VSREYRYYASSGEGDDWHRLFRHAVLPNDEDVGDQKGVDRGGEDAGAEGERPIVEEREAGEHRRGRGQMRQLRAPFAGRDVEREDLGRLLIGAQVAEGDLSPIGAHGEEQLGLGVGNAPT